MLRGSWRWVVVLVCGAMAVLWWCGFDEPAGVEANLRGVGVADIVLGNSLAGDSEVGDTEVTELGARRVQPADASTPTVSDIAPAVHPDLRRANAEVVSRALVAAVNQKSSRELRVEQLVDGDRSNPIYRAEIAEAMADLVLDQAIVRSLESGIAYLRLQPDTSGGKDYFGNKRPYLTFHYGEKLEGIGDVGVVVPVDDDEEVLAANAARKQAFDDLAREVMAYYGTLGLDELKQRRESRLLHLRGVELPSNLSYMVNWRLKWAPDGLGLQWANR